MLLDFKYFKNVNVTDDFLESLSKYLGYEVRSTDKLSFDNPLKVFEHQDDILITETYTTIKRIKLSEFKKQSYFVPELDITEDESQVRAEVLAHFVFGCIKEYDGTIKFLKSIRLKHDKDGDIYDPEFKFVLVGVFNDG